MVLRTVNVPTVSNPWMTWSVLERLQLFIQLCHTLVCMLFLIDAADMQCMYASVSLLLASQKASNCSFNFSTCSLIIAADMSILPLYPYQEHKVQYLYFFQSNSWVPSQFSSKDNYSKLEEIQSSWKLFFCVCKFIWQCQPGCQSLFQLLSWHPPLHFTF